MLMNTLKSIISIAVITWLAVPLSNAGETPKNLIKNGGFEQADPQNPKKPAFWQRPDELGVQWTTDPNSKDHGKAIRIDTSISEQDMVAQWKKMNLTEWVFPKPAKNPIAATYGLSFYSDPVKVEKGKTYRMSFDFKGPTAGEGGKFWVRGYGQYRGKKRRLYETFVNCRGAKDVWKRFSQDFHPTKFRPQVEEVKVMLFAYWPAGVYWFDNVEITPVEEVKKGK